MWGCRKMYKWYWFYIASLCAISFIVIVFLARDAIAHLQNPQREVSTSTRSWQILSDGYSAHLSQLMSPGFTRPAVGNARMFLRKSNFRLSTQEHHSRESKKMARRAVSHPAGHGSAGSEFMATLPPGGGGDGAQTKIVVQDFSSSGGGGARPRDSSPRLQFSSHGKSTEV